MTGHERQLKALRENNPNKMIDLTGKKFGRLTVIERVKDGTPRTLWRCKCECGGEAIVWSINLRKGQTGSCGCLQSERTAAANTTRAKHGHTRHKKSEPVATTPTYRSWRCMLYRCCGKKSPNYHLYGGRGIKVCEQWQGPNGFKQFLADVGRRPAGKTLDRYPNKDGNYEPGNVRWATPKAQAANRRKRKP